MNRICRSLVLIITYFGVLPVAFAQQNQSPEAFFSGLQQRLAERQSQPQVEMISRQVAAILAGIADGKLSPQQAERLQKASARMDALRMRPWPNQSTLLAMAWSHLSETSPIKGLDAWLYQLELLLADRDTRPAERLLDQTAQLLDRQRLAGRGTTNWYLRAGQASFVYDTTLILRLADATLACATLRDSLRIYQTSGELAFIPQQFSGRGGKAGWERFGLAPDEAWVEFEQYRIDMNRPQVSASPVVAYFPGRLNQAVQGSFEDQVYNAPANERTPHPRFRSLLDVLELPNIYPGVDFAGGILMQGRSLIGIGGTEIPASLIFRQGSRTIAIARSQQFDLSRQQTRSQRTAISFVFENDSLFHPGLDFSYDNNRRRLTALRTNEGRGRAPFTSTYHKLLLYPEAAYWIIDENQVHFRSFDGLNTTSRASLVSQSYFAEPEFRRLQMIDEIHPMYQINRYISETNAGNTIPLNFLATYLRKPPEQVVALVLNLVERGYLLYDGETNVITVLPAFFQTIEASTGREDYDVIRLDSETPARVSNFILNISDFSLTVDGVDEVVLSEKQGVQLVPEGKQVVFGKNRDFRFKGHVRAGLFDFYAREAVFEYEPFNLQFSLVDSLAFSVLRNDLPSGAKPEYVKVRNVIANLTGTLRIDEPRNKSGRNDMAEFPSFTSTGESYVYFDQPYIQQGTLRRESFFYVVDPFRIDSLSNFSTENFRITGYLNSGTMFPVIREQLNVMPDYALGFTHKLPPEGYPMFGGLAQYYTELSLSGDGFKGTGQLDYQTSKFFSRQFRFYPDSVSAITDSWQMAQQLGEVQFPDGKGELLKLLWNVPKNTASVKTLKDAANLYDLANFLGVVELSPEGARASGKLSFEQATVSSRWFELLASSFVADTADFSLMPSEGIKPAFLATDYRVNIDFEQRLGDFINLGSMSRLVFPFNQYSCTLDEAQWLMDQNLILLNNRKMASRIRLSELSEYDLISLNLSGSEFVSDHPAQDKLSFFTLEASYDLNKYAIEAREVKILRVADAAVFPGDGRITILRDARMMPLEEAVIIADTSNRMHRIENARVEVLSRLKYNASGNYAYKDVNGTVTIVHLNNISPDNEGITVARGKVEQSDPLMLNPWFAFAGEVILSAKLKTLRFSGGYRPIHNCFESANTWARFDTLVDPTNVRLPVRPVMTDLAGNRINSGLFYSAAQDRYRAYLLQNPGGAESVVAAVSGLIYFDRPTLSFKVEPTEGDTRDYLWLNTNRCIISGQGQLDLGLMMPGVNLSTFGNYNYLTIPDSLYLDLSLALSFPVDDKLIGLMADSLAAANLPGAALNQGNYLFAASKLISAAETERLGNEIALYGSPRRLPDKLVNTLFFSAIRLKWNPETRSFISMGSLSLASINRTMVSKTVDGFIELEQSRVSDGFSFYLMPTAKQWYFFNYRSGLMQMLSSSDAFNTALASIKDDKRTITDSQGDKYEYTLANRRRMVDFLRKMQNVQF
ncbi:MAG: hypothetical protein IPM52_01960 [Bacteroidetes bacterium]|nr:hypothetical protein [Bacteroidota bacterium]